MITARQNTAESSFKHFTSENKWNGFSKNILFDERFFLSQHTNYSINNSVGDPDPSEVWIQILPLSHKGVERTEIMLAK